MAALVCDICHDIGDYDASDSRTIARWHDMDVCLDCLALKEEMDAAEAESGCECVDCFRYRVLHQQGE